MGTKPIQAKTNLTRYKQKPGLKQQACDTDYKSPPIIALVLQTSYSQGRLDLELKINLELKLEKIFI